MSVFFYLLFLLLSFNVRIAAIYLTHIMQIPIKSGIIKNKAFLYTVDDFFSQFQVLYENYIVHVSINILKKIWSGFKTSWFLFKMNMDICFHLFIHRKCFSLTLKMNHRWSRNNMISNSGLYRCPTSGVEKRFYKLICN